ncbi:UNKNOWN [Stylonychia lemnae]|uniref:Uncharacterized protein n=1 Tax=Stylonychia lemnae TaxID=5949 RepID=A0A078B079_STYLE|nr:UNKNOWN [Stylonychia lemnae]|eukprot:CDW86488.1 UNKNOWN [Stylonychia lemnae]
MNYFSTKQGGNFAANHPTKRYTKDQYQHYPRDNSRRSVDITANEFQSFENIMGMGDNTKSQIFDESQIYQNRPFQIPQDQNSNPQSNNPQSNQNQTHNRKKRQQKDQEDNDLGCVENWIMADMKPQRKRKQSYKLPMKTDSPRMSKAKQRQFREDTEMLAISQTVDMIRSIDSNIRPQNKLKVDLNGLLDSDFMMTKSTQINQTQILTQKPSQFAANDNKVRKYQDPFPNINDHDKVFIDYSKSKSSAKGKQIDDEVVMVNSKNKLEDNNLFNQSSTGLIKKRKQNRLQLQTNQRKLSKKLTADLMRDMDGQYMNDNPDSSSRERISSNRPLFGQFGVKSFGGKGSRYGLAVEELSQENNISQNISQIGDRNDIYNIDQDDDSNEVEMDIENKDFVDQVPQKEGVFSRFFKMVRRFKQ